MTPSAGGKTTTRSALDWAVFDITQILAYLVHNMSRSRLYLGFGHFGWLTFFFFIKTRNFYIITCSALHLYIWWLNLEKWTQEYQNFYAFSHSTLKITISCTRNFHKIPHDKLMRKVWGNAMKSYQCEFSQKTHITIILYVEIRSSWGKYEELAQYLARNIPREESKTHEEYSSWGTFLLTNQMSGNSMFCSLVNVKILVKSWESCTLKLLEVAILDFHKLLVNSLWLNCRTVVRWSIWIG